MTPEVKVEVAFGFGPYDPEPLAMDWDDITSDVFEISVTRGRESEFERFPASTATILLRNEDRTYDPLNTSSPYYGQLLPNVPIRITATVDSTEYSVWRGYVDGWPTVWSEAGFAAEVQVAATDAFKLLAERRMPDTLRTWLDGTFTPGLPGFWARMDNAIDNVLVNDGTVGHDGVALAALDAVDPLVPTSTAALRLPALVCAEAAEYTYAAYFPIKDVVLDDVTTGDTWTISAVVQFNGRGFRGIFETEHQANNPLVVLSTNNYSARVNTIGFYIDGGLANITGTSGKDVGDGAVHHIVLVRSGTGAYLYIDGVLDTIGSNPSATGWETGSTGRHIIGRSPLGPTTQGPEIVIDEIMAWPGTALSGTQVAELYDALTVGFSEEVSTGIAIDRVLDEIFWLPDLRSSLLGEVIVKLPANPAGRGVLELLQLIADSEGGRFYVDKEGKLYHEPRSADISESPTIAYTFTDNNRDTNPTDVGLADGTLKITIDDKLTFDAAEVTREGGVTQRAALNDTPLRTITRTGLLFLTDSQSLGLASWYPFRYGTPQPRTESWTVNPEVYPDDWGTILDLEIGDRVSIEITPGGVGSAIELEQHISYIEHRITPEEWFITFNGTPVDPNSYFLWDSIEFADNDNGWADTDGDPIGGAWG